MLCTLCIRKELGEQVLKKRALVAVGLLQEAVEGGARLHSSHRDYQYQALVDAPTCARLSKAAAEAVPRQFVNGLAEIS